MHLHPHIDMFRSVISLALILLGMATIWAFQLDRESDRRIYLE
jgi:hypothetical protein